MLATMLPPFNRHCASATSYVVVAVTLSSRSPALSRKRVRGTKYRYAMIMNINLLIDRSDSEGTRANCFAF